MSQLITSNFDGFWAIISERKVQSRQTWLQMKGIAKLYQIKVFYRDLNTLNIF